MLKSFRINPQDMEETRIEVVQRWFVFYPSLQIAFNCEFLDEYLIFSTEFHFDMKSPGTQFWYRGKKKKKTTNKVKLLLFLLVVFILMFPGSCSVFACHCSLVFFRIIHFSLVWNCCATISLWKTNIFPSIFAKLPTVQQTSLSFSGGGTAELKGKSSVGQSTTLRVRSHPGHPRVLPRVWQCWELLLSAMVCPGVIS